MDRQRDAGWGWGRDTVGRNGTWRRCSEWDPDIGGLEYAPPGLRTVLKGLGASAETAKQMAKAMEGLLATRMLRLMRNKDHQWEDAECRRISGRQEGHRSVKRVAGDAPGTTRPGRLRDEEKRAWHCNYR